MCIRDRTLDRVPGRVMSVCRESGPILDLWMRTPIDQAKAIPGWRPKSNKTMRGHSQPTLKEMGTGSFVMATLCKRVQTSLAHGLPLLIEGETGTGKSALVSALLGASEQVVTIDCAALENTEEDRTYFRALMQQARIVSDIEAEASRLSLIHI